MFENKRAAEALAAALTRARIPAEAVDLAGGCHSARIELTVSGSYGALYLEPDEDALHWQLDNADTEVVSCGTWPAVIPARRNHRTVRLVRRWLKANRATLGRPAPAPIEYLIGDEVNGWMWVFCLVATRYAEALVNGRITPDEDAKALAALYPELTEEYGLDDGDGWEAGIGIIHALAHGWIVNLDQGQDHPDYGREWCWTVQGLNAQHGPDAVERLRNAFQGDVLAAARAFLAQKHTI
ncbi:hypothetical protein OG618_37845 (plasmid) [Kitasatospora sp. NBC_01246]|uniref:hypothetical protein n=1 Tax=Kitasatospora sp. NBC_01246 TaxID=2903570 RepID=UPI002E2EA3B9|nr:hypothetical protein [Kitasatospora sp. NBC_01246]